MTFKPRMFLLASLTSLPLLSYPNRVPAGHAGVPGETNPPCTPCHTVTLNPVAGSVSIDLNGGASYTPGRSQRVTVRISDPDTTRRYGFQFTARTGVNTQAGSFTALAGTTITAQGAFTYINHSGSSSAYSFDWTPPAGAAEAIRLYVAGLASRGTRDSRVYTAVREVRPVSAAPPPVLRAVNAVVNGASYLPVVGPGAWITVFGQNLAPEGVERTWNAESEIIGGKLPKALDGVSVTVNGRPASVYLIKSSQVNVQAPDDDSTGTVEVKVTTPGGSAATFAQLGRYAPGLFAFSPESNRYAAAVHAGGALAAKADLFGGSPAPRPARPGDVIELYGTGFGPTNPPVAAGEVVMVPAPLADLSALRIRIGSVEARVLWAGLTAAGLYQFNVEVPALGAGDHLVAAETGGQTTQPSLYLTVAQ